MSLYWTLLLFSKRFRESSMTYHSFPALPSWCPGHWAWRRESSPVMGRPFWLAANFLHRYCHEQCSFLPAKPRHVDKWVNHYTLNLRQFCTQARKLLFSFYVTNVWSWNPTVLFCFCMYFIFYFIYFVSFVRLMLHIWVHLTRKLSTEASCLATSSFQLTDTDRSLFK